MKRILFYCGFCRFIVKKLAKVAFKEEKCDNSELCDYYKYNARWTSYHY